MSDQADHDATKKRDKRPTRKKLNDATRKSGTVIAGAKPPEPKPEAEKPTLFLLRGDRATPENLALLFKKLTGKDVTPAQLEAARKKLGKPPPA